MAAATSAPITVAIRTVAAEVLVPSLKAEGFNKVRHHWHRTDERAWRAVTMQSGRFNYRAQGNFTIEFGVNFPELGARKPDGPGAMWCGFRARIGTAMGIGDYWWEIADATQADEIEAVSASLETAWQRHGLPYLRACVDPASFCIYAAEQRQFDPWTILFQIGAHYDNPPVVGRLLDRCLEAARETAVSRPDRPLGDHAYGYELLARVSHQLGRDLTGPDRDLALAIVADHRVSESHTGHKRANDDAARSLARYLGVEVNSG